MTHFGGLIAEDLRCERLVEPLGVDVAQPVFSWVPIGSRCDEKQVAYRLIVASNPALLPNEADLWDSGKVESSAVTGVEYGGRALVSRQRCWWSVQLWDRDEAPGPASSPAVFETGLLERKDWKARWIGGDFIGPAPLARCEFTIEAPIRKARAYVTGLGYYELRLNGRKVGDRVLDPATTSYDHDPELRDAHDQPARTRAARVLYSVFDIAEGLLPGGNAVGLMLGNGWYSSVEEAQAPRWRKWGDRPRGLVQIEVELEDGTKLIVSSDETWRVTAGPIVYNDLVQGESYDARLEQPGWDAPGFDDRRWSSAVLLAPPSGELRAQLLEPIRVIKTLAPIAASSPREGVQIFDFGQHLSGWTRVAFSAPQGGEIVLRHAGELGEDGELDETAQRMPEISEARQRDVYRADRDEGVVVWEPRFTLHGFRYAEVTSSRGVEIDQIVARVVHSDVASAGWFVCSEELLNRINQNVRWTYRASFQGMPQDAADRNERVGWLGDPGWVIEDYLYCFDTLAYWSKWLDDIHDGQLPDGTLPTVAPVHWQRSYFDWPDWGTTYPLIVWHLYFFYGDESILRRHYEGVRRTFESFWSRAENGIVSAGLGDHMEPQPDGRCLVMPVRTPVALTSTAWLYAVADIVAKVAALLGDKGTATRTRTIANTVREAFNATFFDASSGRYANGSQAGTAIALWHGLVPEERRDEVVRGLVDEIVDRDKGRLMTGTQGTAALEQVLADLGAADVMYDLATRTDYPSWGYQIEQGATTLWEAWGREWVYHNDEETYVLPSSRNMKLLGAIPKFLYKDVAGICPVAPGWSRMRVKPVLTHRLEWAEAHVRTVRGDALVAWCRGKGYLEVEVEVPPTSLADVWLPLTGIDRLVVTENGAVVWEQDQTAPQRSESRRLRRVGDYLRLEVGGGTYQFMVGEAA